VTWNPGQYGKFADERSRPFFDLLGRVEGEFASIADLGCGTGELTEALAVRWPGARVIGVDDSREMLAKAPRGRVEFVEADLATWRPPGPLGLVFSNAAIQWVPDHEQLLAHWVGMLGPGGVLAVQQPGNFDAPSHVILRELLAERKLEPRASPVLPLAWYVERLQALGCAVDAWETTYVHVLAGEDPVLEWVKGTALTPYLSRVGPDFVEEYRRRLGEAYPPGPKGTLFPFRRLFFVARLRGLEEAPARQATSAGSPSPR